MPRRSPNPRIIFRVVARQSHRTGIVCGAGLAQISGGLNPESQCARAVGGNRLQCAGRGGPSPETLYSRVWDKLGNVLYRALCIEGDYAHGSANALPLQVALASLRTLETRITTKNADNRRGPTSLGPPRPCKPRKPWSRKSHKTLDKPLAPLKLSTPGNDEKPGKRRKLWKP